ncbi:hypothetical protein QA584_17460 [Anaerocolumna sp. AGMB13025]|uniref:hypothetical protein n=1 Tax=Anaerocolumna sp. AGMB13025 TaxID=3039116 RepID=UPI00241E04B8|nr:hypothetical protein [Anaerocolumna sp. AGMB13025]WFR55389.1 hypothetical protein QA584_17460 [Anaerocolumna sp. AGMB13025]
MPKTNKELAIELYSAYLQCSGAFSSNPNNTGIVKIPSNDEMAEQVADLTKKLAKIPDY